MLAHGKHYRTIWESKDNIVEIIDQRLLPHIFSVRGLNAPDEFIEAIRDMYVRGAPLIGVTAAYGMVAAAESFTYGDFFKYMFAAGNKLKAARPTAVNLEWAVDTILSVINRDKNIDDNINSILECARSIAEDDVDKCRKIGEYGFSLINEIYQKKQDTVNILTHCNAGWLATVDYGTATAPIYHAHKAGIPLHVWVDETRPRNQGAKLTAWELLQEGVPHTVIADNTGGHLMQHGMVDIVIVGSDRTTYTGDVANKIGTYLKALAAKDNNIPFYAALPSSTIDWNIRDGVRDIPIEERNPDEQRYTDGLYEGKVVNVLVPPDGSPAMNFAFDVTPARLVTGLITERGVCKADEGSILSLFPERKSFI